MFLDDMGKLVCKYDNYMVAYYKDVSKGRS